MDNNLLGLIKDFEKQMDFENEMLEKVDEAAKPYWRKAVTETKGKLSELREAAINSL